jgi:hypothetical protein
MGLFSGRSTPDLNATHSAVRESLSEERMGQIALAILKAEFKKGYGPRAVKDMLGYSKPLGIPQEELVTFAERLIRDGLDETFAEARKSLQPQG